METTKREPLGWHVISGEGLLGLLHRVQDGENPELVYVEEYANADRPRGQTAWGWDGYPVARHLIGSARAGDHDGPLVLALADTLESALNLLNEWGECGND